MVIARIRCTSGLGLVALSLILASCSTSSGHYDYDFRTSDAVGSWESVGAAEPVNFELKVDGTFSVEGWPQGLYCDGVISEVGQSRGDIWDQTVDYSGTWKTGGEGAEFKVSFVSLGPECRSNWSAVAWTTGGEEARLKIYLSPLAPVDEEEQDQILYLRRT